MYTNHTEFFNNRSKINSQTMKFTSIYTETSRTHMIKMKVHTCFVRDSYLSNKNM